MFQLCCICTKVSSLQCDDTITRRAKSNKVLISGTYKRIYTRHLLVIIKELTINYPLNYLYLKNIDGWIIIMEDYFMIDRCLPFIVV